MLDDPPTLDVIPDNRGPSRRLDHLNADLSLSSRAEASLKRTKRAKGKKKKGAVRNDTGYHFIAYVPVNGHVWELDGLKSRPTKLGKATAPLTFLSSLLTGSDKTP